MSLKDQGLTLQERTDRILGRVAVERSTTAAPRESISEPPKEPPKPEKEVKMAKDEPKVPEFDADKVEQLFGILESLGGSAEYPSIRAAAVMQLKAIDRELWEELYPDQAEAEEKRLEEIRKMEEETRKQREEEAKEKEKAA